MEILFEKSAISLYDHAKKKITELRIISERSELWLQQFLDHPENLNNKRKILQTCELIKEISSMFAENVKVKQDGTLSKDYL